MMSKDLEKKVDDIDGRVELLIKIVHEMADDKKKLIKLVKGQREDIAELSACFVCIAYAFNIKRDKEEEILSTQEKN
jgi:hypothetical protein